MTDLSTYPHTTALVTRLETTGYQVGKSQAPAGTPAPYYVLYPIPSSAVDGPLDDPDADWVLLYQITSVGVGPEQAEGLSDLARATLAATPLTVAGRSIWRVRIMQVGRVDRDDSFQPPLFFTADTIGVATTPS